MCTLRKTKFQVPFEQIYAWKFYMKAYFIVIVYPFRLKRYFFVLP